MSPLQILATVPLGMVVHAVDTDILAPLVLPGEVVIIDRRESDPVDQAYYLAEYVTRGHGRYGRERRDRQIVRVDHRRKHWGETWWLTHGRARGTHLGMSDGPYDGPEQLAERLIGRIVGIYRPGAFASPEPSTPELLLEAQ